MVCVHGDLLRKLSDTGHMVKSREEAVRWNQPYRQTEKDVTGIYDTQKMDE